MTASPCTRHPTRPAEGACRSCGRLLCLECAVPFRGELRCGPCAARELGQVDGAAEDPANESPPGSGMERAAGLVFAAGALASLLPWDRVGTRTGLLSGWSPRPDPWPVLAAVLLLLGAVTALRPTGEGRSLPGRLAPVILGALAAVAATLALSAPDLTVRTPVPWVVLAAAMGGTVLGSLGLRTPVRTRHP